MDVYNLILSPDIRKYLQENHKLTTREKILIIHAAYRSLDDKYDALKELLTTAKSDADKSAISNMLKVYDWAFGQLDNDTPGQMFICADPKELAPGELSRPRYVVKGMFSTYGELVKFFEDENDWGSLFDNKLHTDTVALETATSRDPFNILNIARFEKWALIDGTMERIVSFDVFEINDRYCLRDFYIESPGKAFDEFMRETGITEEFYNDYFDSPLNPLPLPFELGDLVCIEIPGWWEPLYGVLSAFCEEDGTRVYEMFFIDTYNMYYYEDPQLQSYMLLCWDIDFVPNLPVINWLRRAEPSDVPKTQHALLEISDGLQRLAKHDKKAAEKILISDGGQTVAEVVSTINSILKEYV